MDRRIKLAADLTRLVAGSFNAAYKGWGTRERVGRALKQSAADERLSKEHARAHAVGKDARAKQIAVGIRTDDDVCAWAIAVVDRAIQINGGTGAHSPLRHQLITFMAEMCDLEGWFFFGEMSPSNAPQSELWAWEDHLRRVGAFCADFEKTTDLVVRYLAFLIHPLVRAHPHLIDPVQDQGSTITFTTHLNDMIDDLPSVVEGMIQTTYAPELDALNLCQNLRRHLHKKTIAASGGLAVQSGQNHNSSCQQKTAPSHLMRRRRPILVDHRSWGCLISHCPLGCLTPRGLSICISWQGAGMAKPKRCKA